MVVVPSPAGTCARLRSSAALKGVRSAPSTDTHSKRRAAAAAAAAAAGSCFFLVTTPASPSAPAPPTSVRIMGGRDMMWTWGT